MSREAAVDDAEWHAWRRQGLGGSDIGVLLGLSKWASPWSLWADKLGLLPPSPETQRQRIGKRMEAVLAAEFHDHTGLTVTGEQTWCTYPAWSVARCTVDALVVGDPTPGDATEINHADMRPILGPWECKTDGRYGWDEIPANYRAQLQWNMGVTGSTRGWLTVMFAGWKITHYEIAHDPDDFAFMLERAREFWKLVESGTEPEVDGSDATTRAIATVWPEHRPEATVDLTPLVEQITRRADVKDDVRDLEAELAEIDNAIKAAMGDAELATVGGVPMLTLRAQQGRKTTCPACGHVTEGRPFRVLRPAPRKKAA